jgi:hypothetical protein
VCGGAWVLANASNPLGISMNSNKGRCWAHLRLVWASPSCAQWADRSTMGTAAPTDARVLLNPQALRPAGCSTQVLWLHHCKHKHAVHCPCPVVLTHRITATGSHRC